MSERGMIAKTEQVLAFLAGATQMRVPVKGLTLSEDGHRWQFKGRELGTSNPIRWLLLLEDSPFGVPGDVVWFKETVRCEYTTVDATTPSGAMGIYAADGIVVMVDGRAVDWSECRRSMYYETCQANHMPRKLSRIIRTVKRVWVERDGESGPYCFCAEFEGEEK